MICDNIYYNRNYYNIQRHIVVEHKLDTIQHTMIVDTIPCYKQLISYSVIY